MSRILLVVGLIVACVVGTAGGVVQRAGRIVAWGSNGSGQCNVPAGDDFVAISAGYNHSLALRSDGSLVGWGWNSDGQTNVPSGNDYIAISAGWYHGAALKQNGSIVAWGFNGSGQATPPAGNDFVAISSQGAYGGLALKSNGSLATWGSTIYGMRNAPSGNDYIAVSSGMIHNYALKQNGSIAAWGNSTGDYADYGQVSDASTALSAFIAQGGGWTGMALRGDGTFDAWGDNAQHQREAPIGETFQAVAAGQYHGLGLRMDGSLTTWGDYHVPEFNLPPPSDLGFFAISAGGHHNLALIPEPGALSLLAAGAMGAIQRRAPKRVRSHH